MVNILGYCCWSTNLAILYFHSLLLLMNYWQYFYFVLIDRSHADCSIYLIWYLGSLAQLNSYDSIVVIDEELNLHCIFKVLLVNNTFNEWAYHVRVKLYSSFSLFLFILNIYAKFHHISTLSIEINLQEVT